MILPDDIAGALDPLFAMMPLERAMEQLVVTQGPSREATHCVHTILQDPVLAGKPRLAAGLWLYVDDLERSHTISQGMEDSTGSFWHGIMHRREGDFWNSHYWFRRVGQHPAMAAIDGYEPHAFIDEVERRHGESPPELVERQRKEWVALFSWCANA